MRTSISRKVSIAGAILSLALISVVVAQQAQPPAARQPAFPPTAQPRQPAEGQAQWNPQNDHIIVQWLMVDNQGEIELAKLAGEKSQSSDVKKFATMMTQDHGDFLSALQQLNQRAGGPAGQRPAQGNFAAPGAAPPAGNAPGAAAPINPAPTSSVGARPAGGLDMVTFKHELGKQCLASAKDELGHKEGKEFDQCYMGMQTAAHMHMLDTLKVFQRHASPQLADLLKGAIETTEDHLDHAKKMIKDFGPSAETARRSEETEKK